MCPPKISSYSTKVSRGVKKVITANLNLNNGISRIRLIVIIFNDTSGRIGHGFNSNIHVEFIRIH